MKTRSKQYTQVYGIEHVGRIKDIPKWMKILILSFLILNLTCFVILYLHQLDIATIDRASHSESIKAIRLDIQATRATTARLAKKLKKKRKKCISKLERTHRHIADIEKYFDLNKLE